MTFKDYSKKQWELFRDSFTRLDRRFIYILLLEIGLIVLFIIGMLIWNKSLGAIVAGYQGAQGMISSAKPEFLAMSVPDKGLVDVAGKYVGSTVLLFLFLLLAWTLMKQAVYSVLNRVKCAWKTSWKFVLTSILWGAAAFILFTILQLIVYRLFITTFDRSVSSRIISIFLLMFITLMLFYITVAIFSALVRTSRIKQAIKAFWNPGIRTLHHSIVPIIFTILVFVPVNLLMAVFLIGGSDKVFSIGASLVMLAYMTWIRLYYHNVIGSFMAKQAQPKVTRKRAKKPAKKPGKKKKAVKGMKRHPKKAKKR